MTSTRAAGGAEAVTTTVCGGGATGWVGGAGTGAGAATGVCQFAVGAAGTVPVGGWAGGG